MIPGWTDTSGPPRAESNLVVVDPDAELTTTEISDDDGGEIIVPTGTVTVAPVASAEGIPGALVDASVTLHPAEGESFRLVTIGYEQRDRGLVLEVSDPTIRLE